MRRTTAAAGVVAVLGPLLLAGVGAPAASAAGGGSLTVRTLDRSGKPVSAQVAVYNTRTNDFRYIDGNKKTSLPKGSYELATSFTGGNGEDGIVGGHSVKVSGATATTFDARKGRPVKVSIGPAPGGGYDRSVSAAVCATDNSPGTMSTSAAPGDLYVIPNSSKAYELAYGTTYTPRSTTGGDFWLASATHSRGVPSGVSATLRTSGLTTLKVYARSGPDSGQARFSFNGEPTGGSNCSSSMDVLDLQRDLPNSFSVHVPAGQWSVGQQGNDFVYDGFHPYAAGKTTALTLGHAVWGPGGQLSYTWYDQLYFGNDNPFADPTLTAGGVLAAGTVKLTHAGRALYSHKYGPSQEPGAQPRIPGSGWYTITETGHRDHLPAGLLSTSSSLSLHFYADAGRNQQIRAYITRFSPEALNSRNQAASGSTTTIDLGMRRDGTGDSTIGRRVGLRSTVTDTHGDSSTTTVHNAYAVS